MELGRAEVRAAVPGAAAGRHRRAAWSRTAPSPGARWPGWSGTAPSCRPGRIGSLRRFKDDVREVAEGFECGIGLENFQDVHEGDVIEAYEVREVARTLA